MKEVIEAAFPQVLLGNCLEVLTESEFHIFDNEVEPKRCYIKRSNHDPKHFTVNNSLNQEINFLAIDKCVLTDKDKTHCDCAVFTNKQFAFIEISDSKKLHRNQKRRKAKDQLSQTINHFRDKGIVFSEKLNAIICFVSKPVFPARSSSQSAASLEYFENYGAILLEGSQLDF